MSQPITLSAFWQKWHVVLFVSLVDGATIIQSCGLGWGFGSGEWGRLLSAKHHDGSENGKIGNWMGMDCPDMPSQLASEGKVSICQHGLRCS